MRISTTVEEGEMNRIKEVYRGLGQVLNNPESFGLALRPPKPLVEQLTAMRRSLRDELLEQKEWSQEDQWLASELSQDADSPRYFEKKRRRA